MLANAPKGINPLDEIDEAIDVLETAWLAMQADGWLGADALRSIASTINRATKILKPARDALEARDAAWTQDLTLKMAWEKYKALHQELGTKDCRTEDEVYDDMVVYEDLLEGAPAASLSGLLPKAEFMCSKVASSAASLNALIGGLSRPDNDECKTWPGNLAWGLVDDIRRLARNA